MFESRVGDAAATPRVIIANGETARSYGSRLSGGALARLAALEKEGEWIDLRADAAALAECAVLCRTNVQQRRVSEALRDARIKLAASVAASHASGPALRPYIIVLRCLADESDDDALLE